MPGDVCSDQTICTKDPMKNTTTLIKPLFERARKVPFNIAPEQGARLASEIFGERGWTFKLVSGEANFYAIPSEAVVAASAGGLASLWCLCFAAYHLLGAASRHQRGTNDSDAQAFDIGEYCSAMRLGEYVGFARSLFHGEQEWPRNLATPDPDMPLESEKGKVNNLFFGSLAWILLHEIGHVHHKHEKLIPAEQRVRQEYVADNFATRWILDAAGQGLRNEFRVLTICVALCWVFLNEAEMGQGSDHPRAFNRLREAFALFQGLGLRSPALENATYLFKAVFDPQTVPPSFETPSEGFDWMAARLEQLFPR
jgi:hypothetical protein